MVETFRIVFVLADLGATICLGLVLFRVLDELRALRRDVHSLAQRRPPAWFSNRPSGRQPGPDPFDEPRNAYDSDRPGASP